MKVLHFADVHARDRDIDEIGKCLAAIIDAAEHEQPDLIVMAGDTFDSRMVRLDTQAAKLIFQAYSELLDVAPMVVITGTPSHDGLTVQALEHTYGQNTIHVSNFPEQIALTPFNAFVPLQKAPNVEEIRAIISCIPTPTKQYWQEFGGKYESAKETDQAVADAMGVMLADFGAKAAEFDCPHIMVGHFQVGGAYLSETQQLVGQDIELSRDQIGLAEADIVCLGHIHLHQQIGDNIFYSGSIYRKDWGELEEKGFYIHELYDEAPAGFYLQGSRFIQTPTRKRLRISADFTKSPIEELDAVLYTYSREEIEGASVRLDARVYQDTLSSINRKQLETFFRSAGAVEVDVNISPVPRETVRAATIMDLQTLRDKIREMALLRKEEVPETILAKADMLETMDPAELEKAVGDGR